MLWHIKGRNFDPEVLQADNSLIQMGMQWKKRLDCDLSGLRKKKAKLTQSKKWMPIGRET